jgi:hypothetical protein
MLQTTASKAVVVPPASVPNSPARISCVGFSLRFLAAVDRPDRHEDPMCMVTAAGNNHAVVASYFGASATPISRSAMRLAH